MLRNIGAVIVGFVVGMIVNMALIMLNTLLYPPPEGMDMMDPEQMNAYIAPLPQTAFILVLAAHLGQSFVGGWVAARLGATRPITLALAVGMFSLAGGIANLMRIDHPSWMLIELPLYLIVAWIAGLMVAKKRAATA